MNDLLKKFENVKVDAAARIAPEDAAWCESEQANYSRAHKLYTDFRDAVSEAMAIEIEDWKVRNGGVKPYRNKYCDTYGDAGLSNIDKHVKEIQISFISGIRYYFSEKYGVKLDSNIMDTNLGMNAPKYNRYSDSQWEEKQKLYEEWSTRALHYNEIVDEILLQLGGLTFTDKAIQQIKDNASESAHYKYSPSNPYYTVNKKMIQFKESFLAYDKEYSAVLLALWHFNTGLPSLADSYWSRELDVRRTWHGEDKRVGTPYEFEGQKVCKMRYFKNGRWDITFASAELADTFAREYLGY